MAKIQDLEDRRDAILKQMRSIQFMRRGSISKQYLKVKRKGQPPVKRGPYYVFSRQEENKTISRRLKTPEQLEQAQKEVAEHRRFLTLCKEFEQLTERLCDLKRQKDWAQQEKKRRRSSSSRTRK